MAWERDRWSGKSQVVGDFIWPGVGNITVTNRVKLACEKHSISGCNFHAVETQPFQSRKSAKSVYVEAPPIWFAEPTTTTNLDIERSGRHLVESCQVCGFKRYEVDPNAPTVIRESPNAQLPDVFRIAEIPVIFCTAAFRALLINEEFTNVETKLRGIIELDK